MCDYLLDKLLSISSCGFIKRYIHKSDTSVEAAAKCVKMPVNHRVREAQSMVTIRSAQRFDQRPSLLLLDDSVFENTATAADYGGESLGQRTEIRVLLGTIQAPGMENALVQPW